MKHIRFALGHHRESITGVAVFVLVILIWMLSGIAFAGV